MDENTRPWYTIDELNAWADNYQNEQWHKAAIRLGEELSSVGPDGYYEMDAKEWLDWAMSTVQTRTWVGLTKEEINKGLLRSFYVLEKARAWRDGVAWAEEILKEKTHERFI